MKIGQAVRPQHPTSLGDDCRGIGGVLQHPMAVDDVEGRLVEWQGCAVGDAQILGLQPVQLEVLPGQVDGRLRQVDAGDARPAPGEPREVGADAAADLEHALAGKAVEVDQPRQVVQLVEAVVVEIVEELARAHRVGGHLEIVDARVPVGGDVGGSGGAVRPARGRVHPAIVKYTARATRSESAHDLRVRPAHRRRRHLRRHRGVGCRRSAASRWR